MKKLILTTLTMLGISSAAVAAPPVKTVLFVLTGVDYITSWSGTRHKTGYWLEEFSVPYQIMAGSGVQVTIATPNGNRPAADPSSIAIDKTGKPVYWESREKYLEAMKLKSTVLDHGPIYSLSRLNKNGLDNFDAIFFPGGHAPMEDLAVNPDVGKALRYFHQKGKPTALVCHGPIALLSTVDGKSFPYHGYRVTAFSNSEEKGSELGKYLITTPETALRAAGAVYVKGPDWSSNIVEDRELITGQNPASSKAIAEALLRRLSHE